MAVVKTSIAAVSYLNTVPFIYGIRHADKLQAELLLAPPSACARNFIDRKADIALVPAGALPLMDDAEIVTNYCIGAEKSVRTVTVMSNVPIGEATVIHLDSHSMTSALLVRILAAELWHIRPEWRELTDYSAAEHPAEGEAFLFIGDKVFGYEGKFRYTYDLADCWRELTGKPFVFAVWVARKGSAPELIDALESSLRGTYLGGHRRERPQREGLRIRLPDGEHRLPLRLSEKAGAGALPRQGEEVHTTRQSGLSCVRGSATEPFRKVPAMSRIMNHNPNANSHDNDLPEAI